MPRDVEYTLTPEGLDTITGRVRPCPVPLTELLWDTDR
jgi:hypothetical protein